MNTDRLQTQRFELKFQVPEATAVAIRHFVRPYLAPDEFATDREVPAYPVHSLYLDSGDLHTYRATVNGDRDRYKLRVRYYDDSADSPIYLEIKRRVDRCIYKQRARVRREHVPALLGGAWPGTHHLHSSNSRDLAALQKFCELQRRLGARPRARVSYDREAWTSEGHNAVRVTMDRVVQCEPEAGPSLSTRYTNAAHPFRDQVILELKFTNRFPDWLQVMVRTFNLVQGSAAKYVDGVNALGPGRFRDASTPLTSSAQPVIARGTTLPLPGLRPVLGV
jgi:hypothetical protein